jgi:hypothetical protein
VITDRRALSALLLVVGLLSLAALACTSDQTWIIPRTATPTVTPTLIPISVESAFHVGDTVVVVGNTFQIPQTSLPEADQRNNRVIGGGCFPGTRVQINEVAQGEDGNIYYNVHCVLDGWLAETNLQAAE